MKRRSVLLGILMLANCALSTSQAVLLTRTSHQMAAGACQPFVPTSAVRYNASGISNAGTSAFFVVCSMAGGPVDDFTTGDGTVALSVVVTNNSGSTQTTNCTARPGTVVGSTNTQLGLPASMIIGPTETRVFQWSQANFGGAQSVGNANFTCVLNPGHSIQRLQTDYKEDIGA